MGFLPPVDGQIRFNPKTDAAYYAQELEQLDADKTVFENVETDGYNEWQLHGILSNFLFYEDDINKKRGRSFARRKGAGGIVQTFAAKGKPAGFGRTDQPPGSGNPGGDRRQFPSV